jgi:adenosylmethionine-8-amino-7-oxononanoate aminotransferase
MRRYNEPIIMTAKLKSTPIAATPGNDVWLARSRAAVWHPCTQMKRHESWPLVPIARGRGAWLYDFDGGRYLDAVSSWWVNLFGHAHPKINAAIAS